MPFLIGKELVPGVQWKHSPYDDLSQACDCSGTSHGLDDIINSSGRCSYLEADAFSVGHVKDYKV